MQKQALPLIKKETPLVRTEVEKIFSNVSELNTICLNSGILRIINKKKIIIYENIYKKKFKKNITFIFLEKIKVKKEKFKYKKFFKRVYLLKEKVKQNLNVENNQTLKLNKKKWVKKRTLINEGISTKNNLIAIGKNLLICYLTWKGYNFEDAIIINERLIKKNILTSNKIKKIKIFLINNELEEVKFKNYAK